MQNCAIGVVAPVDVAARVPVLRARPDPPRPVRGLALEVTGPGGTSNQGENDGVVVAVSSVMTGALRACSHRHTHGRRIHPPTTTYIERRISEGKTRREANRCLKRYLARSLYRLLENGASVDA